MQEVQLGLIAASNDRGGHREPPVSGPPAAGLRRPSRTRRGATLRRPGREGPPPRCRRRLSVRDSDARCDQRPRMGSAHDNLVAWPQAATNHQRKDGTDHGHLHDRTREVRNVPIEIDEPTRTSAVAIKRGRIHGASLARRLPLGRALVAPSPRALPVALASESTSVPISASDCSRSSNALAIGGGPRPPQSHAKRPSRMTAHGVVSWGTVAAWQTMHPLARSRYALPK
jgi:hypothetical protein